MENSKPKSRHILRNVILGVVTIPVLFIIYVVGSILLSPVFQHFEKAKFEKLDQQSHITFNRVKERSGGIESWSYKAACDSILSGWQTTPRYTCYTEMSTDVLVSYAEELNNLHEKYFPVIDSSYTLKQKTDLDKQYPGQFGVMFVVSSAEKDYIETKSGAECRYLILLRDGNDKQSLKYGLDLSGKSAAVDISLKCSNQSSGDWYK